MLHIFLFKYANLISKDIRIFEQISIVNLHRI